MNTRIAAAPVASTSSELRPPTRLRKSSRGLDTSRNGGMHLGVPSENQRSRTSARKVFVEPYELAEPHRQLHGLGTAERVVAESVLETCDHQRKAEGVQPRLQQRYLISERHQRATLLIGHLLKNRHDRGPDRHSRPRRACDCGRSRTGQVWATPQKKQRSRPPCIMHATESARSHPQLMSDKLSPIRQPASPADNAALTRQVAGLIVAALNLDVAPEEIDPEQPLYGEGLGLDSIDILEIALVVSKEYGVQLRADSEENVRIFSSLRALVDYIITHRTK